MLPTKRISVIVTPEEYERIKSKAGRVPLSTWFRDLALQGPPSARYHLAEREESPSKQPFIPSIEGNDEVQPHWERPKQKTCTHGKGKGWNCGLCGGLAKIE